MSYNLTDGLQRIRAMFLRQFYIVKRSPPRWITYGFWPTLGMLIWGFFNKFLYAQTALTQFSLAALLGASLINNFFERTNVNIMFSFLEDVWSSNIGNILISPIRPVEMIIGYILNGLVGMAVGMSCATAVAFLVFGYNLFDFGIYLVPFGLTLIVSGWVIGLLLISIILRFGPSGESFGWMIALSLSPFVAVFYPVASLPPALQYFSWMLPPTYVFEGLRHLVQTHHFDWVFFQKSLALNLVYLCISIAVFLHQLHKARQRGGLLSMSE